MEIQNSEDWFKAQGVEYELWVCASRLMPKARLDLKVMIAQCGILAHKLSQEEVVCRRLKKQTTKHKELLAQVNERISFIEQMTTMGVLMS